MIKAIAVVGIILAVVLAGILVFAATKPDKFRVQRGTSIKAPPEKIFPLINDIRAWEAWSPYEKRDPAMKRVYSGVAAGKGAVYEWDGNKNVGKGRMEITFEHGGHTRVTLHVTASGPTDEAAPMLDGMPKSWAQTVDRLDRHLIPKS